MTRIRNVFTGFYGMGNFGDDLFADVSLLAGRRVWSQMQHQILAPTDKHGSPNHVVSPYFRERWGVGLQGRALRFGYALGQIARCEHITFAGGSLFSSESSVIRDLFCYSAKYSKTVVSAIGVSLGPFQNAPEERRIRRMLSGLRFISVRDLESYNIARSMGLRCPVAYGRDLAALYFKYHGPGERPRHVVPTIGVAFCNFGPGAEAGHGITRTITDALLATRKRRFFKARIFVLNAHPKWGDSPMTKAMTEVMNAGGLETEIVEHSLVGVSGIWSSIASCDAFLSVRLHGAIAAYLNQVPFILFDYHRKCTAFLDDIGQHANLRLGIRANLAEIVAALELLPSGTHAPRLAPTDYATDSESHFTLAPWAKQSPDQPLAIG